MKKCKCCKKDKPVDDFRRGRKSCIDCDKQNLYRIRKERKDLLWKIKTKLDCVICGEKEPICLDFHHKVGSEKKFKIAKAESKSWENIMKELEKCVILCSNCHRKLHHYLDNKIDHELLEKVKNSPTIKRNNLRSISKKKWWRLLTKIE